MSGKPAARRSVVAASASLWLRRETDGASELHVNMCQPWITSAGLVQPRQRRSSEAGSASRSPGLKSGRSSRARTAQTYYSLRIARLGLVGSAATL
jgi:hypothetical protein